MMQRICTNMETLEFVHAWQLFPLLEDGILLSVGEAPKSLTRDDVSSEKQMRGALYIL